jgi:Zn-finger nucleic acid-binding protein
MERDGVEVNFCPQCRGVWVDRFQLNKIVERGLDAQLEQLRRQKEDR